MMSRNVLHVLRRGTGPNRFTRTNNNTTRSSSNVVLHTIYGPENRQRVEARLNKISPLDRPNSNSDVQKEYAVLVPLCVIDGQPSLLFMMRSMHLNSHAGEVCFPGGMRDPEDADLVQTALRETTEEIGLAANRVDVWGSLPPSPASMRGRWTTPVLGYCGEIDLDQLVLNEHEVQCVFTRTVASLCEPANTKQTQFRYPETRGYTLPVYLGGEYRIWGLTGVMLHQVLTALAPGLYKFKPKLRS